MEREPLDIRLPMLANRSFIKAVDAWRFENGMPSRGEAVRRLVERGLEADALAREVERVPS